MMECNKDEAIRAKELAQKRLRNSDFDGARKMAMKAHQLFPALENISQLLAVCNVHCSAQSPILGSEKDWYSILQLERMVDEVSIKKQYRKLALVLHPDKNQFPGAEAAFKMIGEANLVLSDRGKKAIYDKKVADLFSSVQAKNPRNQCSKIPTTVKQNGVNKSKQDACVAQCTVRNYQKTTHFNVTITQQASWTRCPFCKVSFLYHRNNVGMKVTCQCCNRDFPADIGVPLGTNHTQATSQGVPVPSRSTSQTQAASQDVPSRFNNQPQSSNHGMPCRFDNQHPDTSQGMPATSKRILPAVFSEKDKTKEKVTTGFKPLNTRYSANFGGASSTAAGTDGVEPPNVDHRRPAQNNGNNRRKRRRQIYTKYSESCDTSHGPGLQKIIREEIKSNVTAEEDHGVNSFHQPRRSSRRRHGVSFIESEGDDDDFERPPKRSRDDKSFCGSKEERKGSPASDRKSQETNATSGKTKMSSNLSEEQDDGAQGLDVISDSDSESFSEDDEDTKTYDCPDPEFYNFDKDRAESCFNVGQFWACYDKEGMPRYYAKIKEVRSNPFKVKITWLEHEPDDAFAEAWSKRDLPVSCGKYKCGSVNTQGRFAFSHPIDDAIHRKKGSFMVYPRIGETWALFKDWNTDWVSKHRSPKKYAYDFVEVLSEFTEDAGIEVVFLEKVTGFISLFHHNKSCSPISILPNEVFRFSHRVPSFKMNGKERVGVPAGSFELDTASLPLEQVADAKNPYASIVPENMATERTSDVVFSKSCYGGAASGLRKSPRGLSTPGKENRTSGSPSSAQKGSARVTKVKEISSRLDFLSSRTEVVHLSQRSARSDYAGLSSSCGSQESFHDFSFRRSAGKFAVGQLWALYNSEDKLPNMYGKITKIVPSPLKLHVAMLESCLGNAKGEKSACGTFKVQKTVHIFEPGCFSHLLDVKPSKKGVFEIYPEEKQVWALVKSEDVQLLSSEPGNSEYDVVEIIGRREGFIKVSSLAQLKNYKSVFKSTRKNGSSVGSIDIQVKDVARFSHQIPAFQLTTEKGGCLTGCWELDPASVPTYI